MNKPLALKLVACFLLSVGIVVILFLYSGMLRDQHGSFLREFPPHPAEEGKVLDVKSELYYIAGGTANTAYLGNYHYPLHMIKVSLPSLDTQYFKLNIKGIDTIKFWSPRIQVDSPYYYMIDGTVPAIFKGKLSDGVGQRLPYDSTFFRDVVVIRSGSFAIKTLSGSTGENILGKITECPPYRTLTTSILQKQLDGVFCTDGALRYNRDLNLLVYTYYYRNQFMVMDTSLNLKYRGRTIDTISRARIRPATIASENAKTLASPAYFVNKGVDAAGDWLFVHSNMLAKNELEKAFNENSVIDMYNIHNGKYVFSFYVYAIDGQKMTEFRVFGQWMVVMFKNRVQVWRLKPEYFKELRGKN